MFYSSFSKRKLIAKMSRVACGRNKRSKRSRRRAQSVCSIASPFIFVERKKKSTAKKKKTSVDRFFFSCSLAKKKKKTNLSRRCTRISRLGRCPLWFSNAHKNVFLSEFVGLREWKSTKHGASDGSKKTRCDKKKKKTAAAVGFCRLPFASIFLLDFFEGFDSVSSFFSQSLLHARLPSGEFHGESRQKVRQKKNVRQEEAKQKYFDYIYIFFSLSRSIIFLVEEREREKKRE